jgi:DNA-binding transcriptional ArsR family regulator
MGEFDPAPSEEALEAERDRWAADLDSRQRVRHVVVGLHEPRSVAEIAERASCSPNTARKHLSELADLGVVRKYTDRGSTRYARNDEYVRWRRANELLDEHTAEQLFDQLQALEKQEKEFRDEHGVETPNELPFPDDADHETIHELWEASGEWATVRRRIEIHRDALRMAQRRRDGLPA